ncbi:transporter substrate-binding domain-containing protein [Rhizobium helianthi]|uniref:Transporter substrate-binding domain-containing protein n=1 Tax=Rhizobium helianthi TaxID=1132695 RepID=A0ABW4M4D4_9HYPH
MLLIQRIQGYLRFSISLISLAFLSFLAHTAQAAENAGSLLILADPNERLSKPDLSALPRLRILTTADFPPFNFVDQTNRLAGFHVDLAREICRELAIESKCQIQTVPFGDLQATLEAGNGEAVMAGIAVSPQLRQKFAFSHPYLMLPARFVTSRTADLSGPADMALAGKPVGVVAGTSHEKMLAAFFPKAKPAPFEDQAAMLTALKEGKVTAVFGDGLRLPFWVASAASEKCCRLFDGPYISERHLGEGFAVMTRKSASNALVAAVDFALSQLARKGKMQEIYLRYFPNGYY